MGKQNPLGQRQESLQIDVPLQLNITDPPGRNPLIALTYWVGIGKSPLTAYNLLAEEMSPD
jgi:hypothetical protein